MNIKPLRKRKGSGELYTRRPPTIDFIAESLRWPFDDLLARAAIRDRRHDDYVPSEVLVYHLRQTKSDNTDGRFVAIYNVLRDRVEAACPRANRNVGDKREWAKAGGQAARFETPSLPSSTAARVTATRCAPRGDHLMRRRLPMRVLPMSSTQPSARDDETARPFRCRWP